MRVQVTDIPDWCAVETLGVAAAAAAYDFDGPFGPAALSSVESLAAMWDKSPTKHLNGVSRSLCCRLLTLHTMVASCKSSSF